MIMVCDKDVFDRIPFVSIKSLVMRRIGTKDGSCQGFITAGNVKVVSNPFSITQANGFIMADKVGRWFREVYRLI